MTDDLGRNLHYLCAHYRSVAEVCRRIDINRQQFNKYLSGSAVPSLHNLKRIGDFFGVEESELLLAHEDFVQLVLRRPVGLDVPEVMRRFFQDSRQRLHSSRLAMERYLGLYHAHFLSPAWPDGILRSLYVITGDRQLTYAKAVERLAWRERARRDPFVHKYEGIAIYDENRLYLFDWQPRLSNIFSMTVLYPSVRSRVTFLNGIVTSVTGGVSRRPYSSKILFERLPDGTGFREALESCGVYRRDSKEVDPEIKERIGLGDTGQGSILTATDY